MEKQVQKIWKEGGDIEFVSWTEAIEVLRDNYEDQAVMEKLLREGVKLQSPSAYYQLDE